MEINKIKYWTVGTSVILYLNNVRRWVIKKNLLSTMFKKNDFHIIFRNLKMKNKVLLQNFLVKKIVKMKKLLYMKLIKVKKVIIVLQHLSNFLEYCVILGFYP